MAEVSSSHLAETDAVRTNNSMVDEAVVWANRSAWKNASAAKRWVKAQVQEQTPRKSVKMNSTKFNEQEKPTAFSGVMEFKA